MPVNRICKYLPLLILLLLGPVRALGASEQPIEILIADNPAECLSLEGVFLDGDGYILVDGRNNRARVKFADSLGNITSTAVSTIPLPQAASLPGDIPPSPWGLDRIMPSGDALWAVPASWAGSIAERFDRETGVFLERLPDPGLRASGLVQGPSGDVWAVGRRVLLNISGDSSASLNLTMTVRHIDTAVGHPMGFVILEEPDLFLVEPTGMIRWRVGLDAIVDGYLSPTDIACGPDGTIAVCAIVCDLSDVQWHDQYFSLRDESLRRDDEQVLFGVEDALRQNLGKGYALVLIGADGTVTDAIEMNRPAVACAVDDTGRAHVLTQRDENWAISILDPALDQGFEVCRIPFGIPAMISSHRLASGRDGSLYWDDIFAEEEGQYWGIARLRPSSDTGIFALGTSGSIGPGTKPDLVYREPMPDFIRQTTSLSIDLDGGIRAGFEQFPFSMSADPTALSVPETEIPFTSSLMLIDKEGTLLRTESIADIAQPDCYLSDILTSGDSAVGVLAGAEIASPLGFLGSDGSWNPGSEIGLPGRIIDARIGDITGGLVAWFLCAGARTTETRWLRVNPELDAFNEIVSLSALGCRFLEADSESDTLWVSMEDAEIFELDAQRFTVKGIWENRLPSEAPAHAIVDAEKTSDGLAVLDQEHRALLLLRPEAFSPPNSADQSDVDNALAAIRSALWHWKDENGSYPAGSPSLLDDILTESDRETVRQAFLGGRVYKYQPTDVGYTFIAWSATMNQTVLLCDPVNTTPVF